MTGIAAARPLSAAVASQPRESQYWGNYSLPQAPKLPNTFYIGARDYRPVATCFRRRWESERIFIANGSVLWLIWALRVFCKGYKACDNDDRWDCFYPPAQKLPQKFNRWALFYPTCHALVNENIDDEMNRGKGREISPLRSK